MCRFVHLRARAARLGLLLALPVLISARPEPARLTGRLIAVDGGPIESMSVVLRRGSRSETVTVAPDGTFTVESSRAAGEVEVIVDASSASGRRFHPTVARIKPEDLSGELRVLLVPRQWTIRAGRYRGTVVEISLERAFTPACFACPSYFRAGVRDPTNGRLAPTPTWPATALPIRVAFTGDMPFQRVPPRDSAAFWRIAEDLELDLGVDLLQPARYRETLPSERGSPEDVILVESDPRLRRVGWGSTISQMGDIIYGAIRVSNPGVFSERDGARLVKHEVMHAVGVGHTCAWRSLMAEIKACPGRSAEAPTPEDVAYFEVLTYTRQLQRIFRAQLGLEASLRGEQTGGV